MIEVVDLKSKAVEMGRSAGNAMSDVLQAVACEISEAVEVIGARDKPGEFIRVYRYLVSEARAGSRPGIGDTVGIQFLRPQDRRLVNTKVASALEEARSLGRLD